MRCSLAILRYAPLGLVLLTGWSISLAPLSRATAGETARAVACTEPADALRRERIPEHVMVIAGSGDVRRVPPEVVAILGDGAWKHWNWLYNGSAEAPTSVAIAFSPDSRILVTGGGATVKLWEMASGKLLRTFMASNASFSPDGRILAGYDCSDVYLWEVSTGKNLHTFHCADERYSVGSVQFTADGRRLTVITIEDDDIEGSSPVWTKTLWDAGTGKQLSSTPIEPIESRRDEKHTWTTADGNYQISLNSKESKLVVHDSKHHAEWLQCPGERALLSPDSRTLAVNVREHVEVWDLVRRQRLHPGLGHVECCTAALFSPDGSLLASSDGQGTIKIWTVSTGSELRSIDAHRCRINAIAFSPDGHMLASGADDSTLRIWDVTSGKAIGKIAVGGVGALAFSPDGRTLATAIDVAFEGVTLWDTTTWKSRGDTTKGVIGVDAGGSLAFSPDGKQLAGGRTWLNVWDTATRKKLWGGSKDLATYVAFSPDGKTILSAHFEYGPAYLWDAVTGRQLRVFKDNNSKACAYSVAFHPDGRCVAVATYDGAVRLFDVANGKLLSMIRLTEDLGFINTLSFSPTGRYLATANSNGTVYILRLPKPLEVP